MTTLQMMMKMPFNKVEVDWLCIDVGYGADRFIPRRDANVFRRVRRARERRLKDKISSIRKSI